jgi:hypothetical protein
VTLLPTLLVLGGCGLKNLLPSGPVLKEPLASEPRTVVYTGPPIVPYPVLPVQAFGLRYAIDLVVVTNDPAWDMHEYARIDLGDRPPLWVTKDTDQLGIQTIRADLPDIGSWLPEIPVPRSPGAVAVTETWTGRHLEVDLAYTNIADQPVRLEFEAKLPGHPPAKRNGNTMGHSRAVVAVVLDLERKAQAGRVRMWIGDEPQTMKKVLGIVPFKYLLTQTQGGLAITSFTQDPAEGGFGLTRPASDPWPTTSREVWRVANGVGAERATFDNGVTTMTYTFEDGGLARAEVRQIARPDPVFSLVVSPALPDLRRPFAGEIRSAFAMDVGEEEGHGCGSFVAKWVDATTVELAIRPTSPRWLADRPMTTRIHYEGTTATVETARDSDAAALPGPCASKGPENRGVAPPPSRDQ